MRNLHITSNVGHITLNWEFWEIFWCNSKVRVRHRHGRTTICDLGLGHSPPTRTDFDYASLSNLEMRYHAFSSGNTEANVLKRNWQQCITKLSVSNVSQRCSVTRHNIISVTSMTCKLYLSLNKSNPHSHL